MYGLEAVQQANGWAMAFTGACIVLCGLAVLSLLISMIPRLTNIFEKSSVSPVEIPSDSSKQKMNVPDKLPDDINTAASLFIANTEDIGQNFTLFDLHRKAKEVGLPHPHLSITRFRDAGIIVSVDDERYSWQTPST